MGAVTDLGAQQAAPFFSSSLYTVGATLAVTAIVLLLMSVLPRLVALLFRRLTPDWIDGVTTLLLVLLLLGQVTILLRWLWPDLPYLWPLFLLLTVGIAAFLPANPISDGLAYLRLRRAAPYQVWDMITVGKQQGQVATMRPLYTELITSTAERVRVPNSIVLRRSLIVHGKATPSTAVTIAAASVVTEAGQPVATPTPTPLIMSTTAPEAAPIVPVVMSEATAPNTAVTPPTVGVVGVTPTSVLALPLAAGNVPPLRKREGLGATSIKGLMRT